MTRRTRVLTAALGVFALVVAVLAVTVVLRKLSHSERQKDAGAPVSLDLGEQLPHPSLWVDIHEPKKAWKSLRSNGWLSRVLADPLGQGMTVGWSGFLGTSGADLAEAFQGLVLDLVTDKLLADPLRIIYFSGEQATGTPAVVVPRPSSGAQGAYDLLQRVSHKGSYRADGCPGADQGQPKSNEPIIVSRWLIAEQAVFAGKREGRFSLAKSPRAVIQALCVALPEPAAAPGADLSISFAPDAIGRETQLAAALLGLGSTARLTLAVVGDHLEPRGLLGDLSEPERLGADSPPEPLLKLAPADTGVVMMATLRLPESLTRDSLKLHLGKSYSGKLTARSVMVLWNPRGNSALPTEVAVIWPQEDSGLLQEAFSGPNRMEHQVSCGYQVLASTGALADTIQRTCQGKSPSLLNAAPSIVAGMKQPVSIGVGLNAGVILSRLLGEAYAADPDAAKGQAPEIDSARRLLEELPFLGFRGAVQGQALVPGGFRS